MGWVWEKKFLNHRNQGWTNWTGFWTKLDWQNGQLGPSLIQTKEAHSSKIQAVTLIMNPSLFLRMDSVSNIMLHEHNGKIATLYFSCKDLNQNMCMFYTKPTSCCIKVGLKFQARWNLARSTLWGPGLQPEAWQPTTTSWWERSPSRSCLRRRDLLLFLALPFRQHVI